MASRNIDVPDLTPGQATYILERLLRDRRISSAELSRYRNDINREIEDLERRLQSLRDVSTPAARAPQRATRARTAAGGARRGRAKRSAPPARRRGANPNLASMQLQGRYLSLVRQIPQSRRAPYQKIAREKGREAAISEMQSAVGRTRGQAGARSARPRETAVVKSAAAPRRTRRRRGATNPQVAASMQLQGRYLGLIRQIPESRRAQYQKIAREKGREAAIREMQDTLRK